MAATATHPIARPPLAPSRSSALTRASLLLLLCPLAAQADLIGDSQLNLGLRNFYIDRDFRGDGASGCRRRGVLC